MKRVFFFAIALTMVACTNKDSYLTIKTGPDRYTLTGLNQSQLHGNAYKVCKDDGFDDYSIVDERDGRIAVRCEKKPKTFSESANEAWESVKRKVDEYRKEYSTEK